MRYYFTADCHFNHDKILQYAKRPFLDIETMNSTLIENWNERVRQEDTIFHLGDFAFKDKKTKSKINTILDQLNGTIILVKGNHDQFNYSRIIIDDLTMTLSGKHMQLIHDPKQSSPGFDLVLCGHVHQYYKFKTLSYSDVKYDVCNVGVDQWGYYPVSIETIINEYNKWKKEKVQSFKKVEVETGIIRLSECIKIGDDENS